jgi:hypothetical protein
VYLWERWRSLHRVSLHAPGARRLATAVGVSRWCAYVTIGHVKGKQKRKYIYGKTRKEVAEKLKAALRDQQLGGNIARNDWPLRRFDDLARRGGAASTAPARL